MFTILLFFTVFLIQFNFDKIYFFFNQFKNLSLKEKIIYLLKIIGFVFSFFFGLFFIYKFFEYVFKMNKDTSFFFNSNLENEKFVKNNKTKKFQIFKNLKLFFKNTQGVIYNEKSLPNLTLGDFDKFDKKLNLKKVYDDINQNSKDIIFVNNENMKFDQKESELKSLEKKKKNILNKIKKNEKKYFFNFISNYFNKKNVKNLSELNNQIEKNQNKLILIKKKIKEKLDLIYSKNKNIKTIEQHTLLNELHLIHELKKNQALNFDLKYIKEKYSNLEINQIFSNIDKDFSEMLTFSEQISPQIKSFLNKIKTNKRNYLIKPKTNFNYDFLIDQFFEIGENNLKLDLIYLDLFLNVKDNYFSIEKKRLRLIKSLNFIIEKNNKILKKLLGQFLLTEQDQEYLINLKNNKLNLEIFYLSLDYLKLLFFLLKINNGLNLIKKELFFIKDPRNPSVNLNMYYPLIINYNKNIKNHINQGKLNFKNNFLLSLENKNFLDTTNTMRFNQKNEYFSKIKKLNNLQKFVLSYYNSINNKQKE